MNKPKLVGITFTLVVHLGLAGGVAAFSDWGRADDEPEEKKFFAIEAALAYKSDTPTEQPQKPRAKKPKQPASKPEPTPTPTPTPTPPDPAKPDKPKQPTPTQPKPEDFTDDFQRYLEERQTQEAEADDTSEEEGPDTAQPRGQFDGSKRGFAEISRGDPYMQKLAAQVYDAWELTTLEKGQGAAVGCVRLIADGSVVAHELWQPTKNANIDLSVKNALAALQKTRKPGESPVPPHLMDATTQWTCFKFSVDGQ